MTLGNPRKCAIKNFQRWPTECHTFQRIDLVLGCMDGEANLEKSTRLDTAESTAHEHTNISENIRHELALIL